MWTFTPRCKMSTNSLENENEKNETKTEDTIECIDYSFKHALGNVWILWYYDNQRHNTWEENLKEIAPIPTVEDFWSLYNHIIPASDLRQGCDYNLFKKGIRPMWEDEANIRGGRWLINIDRKQRSVELDRSWLDTILCLIGEAFEHCDDVCGAVVNIRSKGDKIAVWTADAGNVEAVMEIGRKLKERLRIPPKLQIVYQAHKDTMDKTGSTTKHTYTI